MKKSLLFKTGVLSAVSALTIGATVFPFTSLASESSGDDSAQQSDVRRNAPRLGMMGPVGEVTAVSDAGDGTGTITLTLKAPERPEDAPELTDSMLEKIQERMETFFAEHPDAPKPGDSVTVAYDSETKFMIGGEEVSVADVTVGAMVRALGTKLNTNEAAEVITDALRPPMGEGEHPGQHGRDDRNGQRPRGMIGEVASIDSDANTVTITLPDDSDEKFTVGQQVHVGRMMHMEEQEDGEDAE